MKAKGDYIEKWWHNFRSCSFPKYKDRELFDRAPYILLVLFCFNFLVQYIIFCGGIKDEYRQF